MPREALKERLLERLRALGGSAGNARLQEELSWQPETYERVRDALLDDGAINLGRGGAGSVDLTNPQQSHEVREVVGRSRTGESAQPARTTAATRNGGTAFEQTFKAIDNVLRNEAGQTTELDYTEQTSWTLFLKYLDDLEEERATRAELEGKPYKPIIDKPHRWTTWAAPRKPDSSFDHDRALTGDDLIDYVNKQLWPYLQDFKRRATGPDTIEYKIGEVFSEIRPKFLSGYSLIHSLRAGGRAGIVIKNTFLSNTDGASIALRRELLESCDLHTILDMPQGTFEGAGVKTVVLFFEKGRPTRHIWYYQLDPGRSLGKPAL